MTSSKLCNQILRTSTNMCSWPVSDFPQRFYVQAQPVARAGATRVGACLSAPGPARHQSWTAAGSALRCICGASVRRQSSWPVAAGHQRLAVSQGGPSAHWPLKLNSVVKFPASTSSGARNQVRVFMMQTIGHGTPLRRGGYCITSRQQQMASSRTGVDGIRTMAPSQVSAGSAGFTALSCTHDTRIMVC